MTVTARSALLVGPRGLAHAAITSEGLKAPLRSALP